MSTMLRRTVVVAFAPSRSSRPNPLTVRWLSSEQGKNDNSYNHRKKRNSPRLDDVTDERMDRLAAAFDELAKRDGLDERYAFHASDSKFDDISSALDPGNFDDEVNEDGLIDDEDMDSRIAQALKEQAGGSLISGIPDQNIKYRDLDFSPLGFVDEEDPQTVQYRPEIELIRDAMVCSACGADFQSTNATRPGYLPDNKFQKQVKLKRLEGLQNLATRAQDEEQEWSAEDEVEWLLKTSESRDGGDKLKAADLDIEAEAAAMGIDLEEERSSKVICKRCHGLQNFGEVEDSLRPGWTEEPLLSQRRFRELLKPIRDKPAVIIALVDVFDFAGSVLPELDMIAGDNPVIIAANKVDLLPKKMGPARVENWVRRELEYEGIQSLANVGGAVRLISCRTGAGVSEMLDKAKALAHEMKGDLYLVGAANAGKSTLINYILEKADRMKKEKLRAGNRNKRKGAVTTSPLPGTTLKFIKVDIGHKLALYDTPGLLVNGTITQLLTPKELKMVVPSRSVEPISFRSEVGKTILIGGLAKIELIGDSRPFMFTFYIANGVKIHKTNSEKADEVRAKHAGQMLVPPLEPGPERLEQIGDFEYHEVDIKGRGWMEAGADISLTGLGWVAVTGVGEARIRIGVPKGVGVALRPPLMPFDIWETAAKYTGSRAVRKAKPNKWGRKRRGVGRN